MPLQDYMKLVSVDDHLIEHPRVWLDRLPKADHERGPRIIETEKGSQVWTYQGEIYPTSGSTRSPARIPATGAGIRCASTR